MTFWAKCKYIFTITGAGGSDHEEREAAEGFTELVPRLETTWNVDMVKANWEKNYVVWLVTNASELQVNIHPIKRQIAGKFT